MPSPQDVQNYSEDKTKNFFIGEAKSNEHAPPNHFFGGGAPQQTAATSFEDKTIKVQHQAPVESRNKPAVALQSPEWFGDGNSDPFASIGMNSETANKEPLKQTTNVPLKFAQLPDNLFTNTANIGSASFIGDETFDQLSSGSASVGAAIDNEPGLPCPRCRKISDSSSVFCDKCGLQLSPSFFSSMNPLENQPLNQQAFNQLPTIPQPTSLPLQRMNTMESVVSGRTPSVAQSSFMVQPSIQSVASQVRPQLSSASHIPGMATSAAPLVSFAIPPSQSGVFSPVPQQQQQYQQQQRKTLHQTVFEARSVETAPTQESIPKVKSQVRVHPIMCFGFGGQLFVSFPAKQMRFAVNAEGHHSASGNVHYRPGPMFRSSISTFHSLQSRYIGPIISSLNGQPLWEKITKVKDVEGILQDWSSKTSPPHDSRELLFKLLLLMLKIKGSLADAEVESIRNILLPDSQLSARNDLASPITSGNANNIPSGVMNELTKLLIKGDRSNAVLLAVSHQMWSHALLIASHIDAQTYLSTVSEFARQSLPHNHPLRTMYLLFASQNELAGAELRNNSSTIKNYWLWNLSMILSNRTSDDYIATIGLGDSLMSIGEVFAAHICYLLSDDANLISGPDFADCRLVLLGCDHRSMPYSFWKDFVSLRKTEILEFALRQASDHKYFIPHLQAYKLIFATWLSDLGLSSLAIKYCESVRDMIKNSPPGSQYLNSSVLRLLGDLHERLAIHLNVTISTESERGWLPKMGGLLEAFDRGLTKVMGVSEGNASNNQLVGTDSRRFSIKVEDSSPQVGMVPPPGMSIQRETEAHQQLNQPYVMKPQHPMDQPKPEQNLSFENQVQEGTSQHYTFQNPNTFVQSPTQQTANISQYSSNVPSNYSYQPPTTYPNPEMFASQPMLSTQPPMQQGQGSGSISEQAFNVQQQNQFYNPIGVPPPPVPQSVNPPTIQKSPQIHQSLPNIQMAPQIQYSSPSVQMDPQTQQTPSNIQAPQQYHYNPPNIQTIPQIQQNPPNIQTSPQSRYNPPNVQTSPQIQQNSPNLIAEGLPKMMENLQVSAPGGQMEGPAHHHPNSFVSYQGPHSQSFAQVSGIPVGGVPLHPGQPTYDHQIPQISHDNVPPIVTSGNLPQSMPLQPQPQSQAFLHGAPNHPTQASPPFQPGQVSPSFQPGHMSPSFQPKPVDTLIPPVSVAPATDLGSGTGQNFNQPSLLTEGDTISTKQQPQGKQSTEVDFKDGAKDKKGMLGFLSGWFKRTDSPTNTSPKEANLGEPSSFRYDENLKRWVDTKDPSTMVAAVPTPPPPSASLSGNNLNPMDPSAFRRGATRSARSRYIDPLNPDDSQQQQQQPPQPAMVPMPGIPTPGAPPMVPMPSNVPIQSQQPPNVAPSQTNDRPDQGQYF